MLSPAAAPAGRSAGRLLTGEKMQRGSRCGMEGRDLVFQNDGNLCIYAGAGDRWIWCVNNDPQVQSA